MFFEEFGKKSRDFFVNHDLFGHLITFNFDRKGDTHKTLIGGSFSVLVKMMMAVYIYVRVAKLIFRSTPDTTTSDALLKVDLHGDVPMSDLHMTSFYVLNKQLGITPYVDDPELPKYVDIYFEEKIVDWNKPASERVLRRRIKAERCTAEHFGPSE
jgi:hypothetical protein